MKYLFKIKESIVKYFQIKNKTKEKKVTKEKSVHEILVLVFYVVFSRKARVQR